MTIFELQIFGLTIAPTYYGLMYAIGFIAGYQIIRYHRVFSQKELDDLLFLVFLGVILGGRLGYVFFYDWTYFSTHLTEILMPWLGGMSFHGGVIGVILALVYFSYTRQRSLYFVADEVTIILPIGIGAGRIGNYLNTELVGFAPYSGPFAMIREGVAHFPTPLIEASLEGVVLGIILYLSYRSRRFIGQVAALFLIGYGVARLIAELTRLPDPQIGYLFSTDWITMGMLLTIPMIVGGVIVAWIGSRRYPVS